MITEVAEPTGTTAMAAKQLHQDDLAFATTVARTLQPAFDGSRFMSAKRSEHFGELQTLVEDLFATRKTLSSTELVLNAEILDLPQDLLEICKIVPYGTYDRQTLCDQINSAITAHGWGGVYGTVD